MHGFEGESPSGMLILSVAVLAVIIGAISQLEGNEEVLLASKTVALTTNRPKVFQFLSDMRNYKRWYPRITQCDATDMAPISIGKHYFLRYDMPIFGETTYNVMISGYESPRYISFVIDDWLKSRVEMTAVKHFNHLYPTSLTWKLYSRNKSYLMQYVLSPFIGLTYTNEVRASLFNLRHIFTT